MNNISLFFMSLVLMEGVFGESVSVKEGESITLHTGLSQIPNEEVMDWTFGPEQNLIARVRKNLPTTYDDELNGKFKGRLKLDGQTGNLTILNTTSSDSGDYKVSNSINTFSKSISVSVIASTSVAPISGTSPKPGTSPDSGPSPEPASPDSGLSSGAIAGIVIGVIAVVAAAVGGGVYYGSRKEGPML